jgi:hypothetical protein
MTLGKSFSEPQWPVGTIKCKSQNVKQSWLLSLFQTLQSRPSDAHEPSRDSGVFLKIGSVLGKSYLPIPCEPVLPAVQRGYVVRQCKTFLPPLLHLSPDAVRARPGRLSPIVRAATIFWRFVGRRRGAGSTGVLSFWLGCQKATGDQKLVWRDRLPTQLDDISGNARGVHQGLQGCLAPVVRPRTISCRYLRPVRTRVPIPTPWLVCVTARMGLVCLDEVRDEVNPFGIPGQDTRPDIHLLERTDLPLKDAGYTTECRECSPHLGILLESHTEEAVEVIATGQVEISKIGGV